MRFTKLATLILIVWMLIGAGGCKEEKIESLKQIKVKVQAETPAEAARKHKAKELKVQRKIDARRKLEANAKLLDAYCMAQRFVESNLKCPRTAKWPWISYNKITIHLGNGRYQISSYLDAQNGFGALVRVHFICIVQHIGGSNWRLISLTF